MKCTHITDNGSLKKCTGYEILQAVASQRPPPVFPLRGRYPECALGTQERERESFIWHWKSEVIRLRTQSRRNHQELSNCVKFNETTK